jgi:hypothetical protein
LTRALVPLGSGLVALVLSHSLVFLARYGSTYGEALAHEGHDATWTLAVWSTAFLGTTLAAAGLLRLLWLGRAVAARPSAPDATGAVGEPAPGVRAWLCGWLASGMRLAAITAVLLTVQENAEHLGAGLTLQGPLMLVRPDYPFALLIVVAASLAVSLVVQLYRRRRDQLLARLRAAPATFHGVRAIRRPDRTPLEPPASILGRVGGLRAPPALLAS